MGTNISEKTLIDNIKSANVKYVKDYINKDIPFKDIGKILNAAVYEVRMYGQLFEGNTLIIIEILLKVISKQEPEWSDHAESSFHLLCCHSYNDVGFNAIKLFLKYGMSGKSMGLGLRTLCRYDRKDVVNYILLDMQGSNKINLALESDILKEAAHAASHKNNHDIVYSLFTCGADISALRPPKENSAIWIVKNKIGFALGDLSKYKEDYLSLFEVALQLYAKKGNASLLSYLKTCPEWQKIHVLRELGKTS